MPDAKQVHGHCHVKVTARSILLNAFFLLGVDVVVLLLCCVVVVVVVVVVLCCAVLLLLCSFALLLSCRSRRPESIDVFQSREREKEKETSAEQHPSS